MKINKILILSLMVLISLAIVLMIFVNNNSSIADNNQSKKEADIYDYTGEKILYLISPLGRAEYNNLGLVDLNGVKVNLVTLRTKVLMVDDMEKIYSDPVSLLPLKIERTISSLFGKEYKTEEYDQKKFIVVMKKFKNKKLVKEQIIKTNGPIQNVILFLFYLRNYPDLKKGWNYTVRVPDEFKAQLVSIKLELVSIDKISVCSGKFQAYHFKTVPGKFEIWINKDDPRVPLRIKIKSIIDFNVLMKKYGLKNKFSRIEAKP
jgi:hypothetical protein